MPALLALAALCLGLALGWLVTHPEAGLDLNDIPLSQAFWSLGIVLLLMRVAPPMTWLARTRPLDRLVTALSSRPDHLPLAQRRDRGLLRGGNRMGIWRVGELGYLVVALVILTGLVLAPGWIEDLSARRRPRLLPWTRPGRTTRAGRPAGLSAVGAQTHRQQEVTAVH
ncbi:hypothetical protein OG799_09590 [Micromonospora sp. NBC_00898]|uniref:hypothetical protein n=1 Tax=Micromonospora sp. NBC_00898 TaxID=2975981 RepID=UPI00386FDB9A|nr:hypothetical protein OG799_09590 [Micromonospora sp. NBC_00898]